MTLKPPPVQFPASPAGSATEFAAANVVGAAVAVGVAEFSNWRQRLESKICDQSHGGPALD